MTSISYQKETNLVIRRIKEGVQDLSDTEIRIY
jgi:hypothetical protein